MCSAIRVQDLHVSYRVKGKPVHAVRGLSFHVEPGEVVGFLGPNGAGKSSTLKCLMGFVQADAGTVSIFGGRAGEIQAKSQIGYLPEVALYYPFLTPRETLRLYGELQGLSGRTLRDEIERLLEVVGISQAGSKQNRTLSKGMLQRVGIAQALLGSPSLLILDEMTSGLDPLGRRQLRELLQEVREQGVTMFFSSHELAEVELLCDRVLVIHQGQLVEERQMDALMDDLRQYSVRYRGRTSLEDLASEWRQEGLSGTARFHDKDRLMLAIARIHAAGGELLDLTAQEGSLEDYFIETVRRAA